jgi:hypothetical protein
MSILHRYLLRNRHVIDKHIWWLNTDVESDTAYLDRLVAEFPDFYEVQTTDRDGPMDTFRIHAFYPACCDPDAIYIRMDDDICWMADDALETLASFRTAHPEPFLVYGNIVNNSICNHIHRELTAIPADLPLTFDVTCPFSWKDAWNGILFHTFFLKHRRDGTLDRYKFETRALAGYERFSINVMSWMGRDFAEFAGAVGHDEEPWLSSDKPAELQRPCVICGNALFVHFAFHTQRDCLEQNSDFLAAYAEISDETGF